MHKANRLNICLIKQSYLQFDQIVVEDAIGHPVGEVGTFYVEASHPQPPPWLTNFFGAAFVPTVPLVTSSAKGVLLTKVQIGQRTHIFAVIFGFGRHLLRNDVIEDRFGLKVVLNSVDHKNLRSIDKTSLGSVPKQTREQMSREAAAADFGIDIEQDLIGSVTGKSRIPELGRTISGRDALSVLVKVDVTGIHELLRLCFARYQSVEYKEHFGWIDQIKPVKDLAEIVLLDGLLVTAIAASQFDKLWLAPPEIIDWLILEGFRYNQPKRSPLVADLDLREFVAAMAGQSITIDLLRETPIHLISTAGEAVDSWSAYKCLCAEVDHSGTVYVLNNGKWYEVIRDFAVEVNRSFDTLPACTLHLPDYSHPGEGEYNEFAITQLPNSYLMDKKTISHGGGYSSIEFCDIATADKRLIHVKRYGGSSQLSHLFSQGVVSGELFVQDAEFRRKLNAKLPRGRKLGNTRTRPVASDYEIVFAIVSKSQNALNLPFFSKVTIRNARQRLEGYGYKVSKAKIQHV